MCVPGDRERDDACRCSTVRQIARASNPAESTKTTCPFRLNAPNAAARPLPTAREAAAIRVGPGSSVAAHVERGEMDEIVGRGGLEVPFNGRPRGRDRALIGFTDLDDRRPPSLRDPPRAASRATWAEAAVQTISLASLTSIASWTASTDEPGTMLSGEQWSFRAATNVSMYSGQLGRTIATLAPDASPTSSCRCQANERARAASCRQVTRWVPCTIASRSGTSRAIVSTSTAKFQVGKDCTIFCRAGQG